jgi:outer membrane lipoprotein carrier protein
MLLACSSALFWVIAFFSVAPEVKAALAAFEARYRSAHSLQAQFLEEYREQGRITRSEAGTVYFQKPGKMRWEYAAPESTVFLVDGKSAWFYVPADHTVTRVPAKESSDWRTPLALLAGGMKLGRICQTVELAESEKPAEETSVVLYCRIRGSKLDLQDYSRGKKSAQGRESEVVLFEILRETGELVRVQVRDPGGVAIDFHFKNWQVNPPLGSALFRFSPPPGVAIVNGELPAPEAASRP